MRILRTNYLYVRTRLSVPYVDEAIQALAGVYLYPVGLLELGRPPQVFSNGFVLKLENKSGDGPRQLAETMREGLSSFDAWAIHDSHEFVESVSNGPLQRFFDVSSGDVSQIIVMGNPQAPSYDRALQQCRSAMRAPCLPVFHFEDGQIQLLASREPAKITAQRAGRHLDGFDAWAIVDGQGVSYSCNGEDDRLWSWLYLNELAFGEDET